MMRRPLTLRSLAGLLALAATGLAGLPATAKDSPTATVTAPPPLETPAGESGSETATDPAAPAAEDPAAPAAAAKAAPAESAPEAEGAAAEQTAVATINREILLELRSRTIHLVENGVKVRSWPVAIGDPSTPTPTGSFKVENKVLNPRYQSTSSGKVNPTVGPSAPLGDRWIGFKMSGINQYGIHGTPWPHWVQTRAAVSNGCVRMLNTHVRELFDKVELGTPVTVVN
jgi:lipoprotein-anchoring transpeptidase ErfK/SrfK